MRFWGVAALRYIKSEEITPVELMTANEWSSQPTHSTKTGQLLVVWSSTGTDAKTVFLVFPKWLPL
jgi:hypothetical protein